MTCQRAHPGPSGAAEATLRAEIVGEPVSVPEETCGDIGTPFWRSSPAAGRFEIRARIFRGVLFENADCREKSHLRHFLHIGFKYSCCKLKSLRTIDNLVRTYAGIPKNCQQENFCRSERGLFTLDPHCFFSCQLTLQLGIPTTSHYDYDTADTTPSSNAYTFTTGGFHPI